MGIDPISIKIPVGKIGSLSSTEPSVTPVEIRESESSYTNTNASNAISNTVKAFIQKRFVPASTKEELICQMEDMKWLKEDDVKMVSVSLEREMFLPKSFFNAFSKFLNETNKLSNTMKSNFNLYQIFDAKSKSNSNTYLSGLEKFSSEAINKLNPEIQKLYSDKIILSCAYGVIESPEEVNCLYQTLNEDKRQTVFEEPVAFVGDKQILQEKIQKAKALNNINDKLLELINPKNIVINRLPSEYIKELVNYMNGLTIDSSSFDVKVRLNGLLNDNYSYSLDNLNNEPTAGTDKFHPISNKKDLKKELASTRDENNIFLFSNKDIEQIINNENDNAELSKILDFIKRSDVKLDKGLIKTLLLQEGITLDYAKSKIEFLRNVDKNPKFENLRKLFHNNANEILSYTPENIKKIEKNLWVMDVLIKYCPEEIDKYSKRSLFSKNEILETIMNTAIEKESFEKIVSNNLLPQKLSLNAAMDILTNEKLNNVSDTNINFVKDLKNDKRLSFLFAEKSSVFLFYHDIINILTKELPDGFKYSDKSEIVDFIIDSYKKSNGRLFNMGSVITAVLSKPADDKVEDGERIIDFIKKHLYTDSFDINSIFFIRKPFNEMADLLEKFEKYEHLNGSDPYGFIVSNSKEDLDKYYEVLSYLDGLDSFKNIKLNANMFFDIQDLSKKGNCSAADVKTIKSNLKKFDELSKTMSPKLWNLIKEDCYKYSLINSKNKDVEFKKENIKLCSDLIEDERTEKFFRLNDCNFSLFLIDDLDTKKISDNKDKMFEFIEKYIKPKEDSNQSKIYMNAKDLLTYAGDINGLDKALSAVLEEYPNTSVSVSLDKKNNAFLSVMDSKGVTVYQSRYDKDFNLLSTRKTETQKFNDGKEISKIVYNDNILHEKHNITEYVHPIDNSPVLYNLSSEYYDENNNLLKTKKYSPSNIDGVMNISETDYSGKTKTLCSSSETKDGISIHRNLESPDGTKTDVDYHKDIAGNEIYDYKIVDKFGVVLANLQRTTEIIDENNKITTVNDKKFKVTFAENKILVSDLNTGESDVIDLDKINPEKSPVLNDMLQDLSGDELIKLNKYVNALVPIKRLESGMEQQRKIMYIGPHKFIFEHEFGHAKDSTAETFKKQILAENVADLKRKITGDPELLRIFEEEKARMKSVTSECIQEYMNYFINENSHYAGKFGGLIETVAEVNAIQTNAKYHPLLQMRTQLLQEYFPRTIAYLVNNSLL